MGAYGQQQTGAGRRGGKPRPLGWRMRKCRHSDPTCAECVKARAYANDRRAKIRRGEYVPRAHKSVVLPSVTSALKHFGAIAPPAGGPS